MHFAQFVSTRDQATGTLLCGDLFTHVGGGAALVETDILGPAIAAEEMFQATALAPRTPEILRRLAELKPRTLALMHGAYRGDCAAALRGLADYTAERMRKLAA